MEKFLTVYDYGQGGVWWYILAESPSSITAEFPDLTVFDSPPKWWDEEMEKYAAARTYRLGDPITDAALAYLKR